MRAVLISDVHLRGNDDPRQSTFVTWLDGLEADELIVLGDLFHHWWGFRSGVVDDYVDVAGALRRARERGMHLVYVPGNHDFALGPFFHDTLTAEVRGPHRRAIDGLEVFLSHGDEADRTLGYRLTRRLLRGRPMAASMRLLGPARGMALLRLLAGASAEHGGGNADLVAAQRNLAAREIEGGAQLVVLGHSHVAMDEAIGRGRLVNLGYGGERHLEIDGGEVRLISR